MELRHLRYFVAVAEELNYRKAAERLRVAQPALSSQIKDIETELGVRLLDRNTAGVRLTDAGRVFLSETRRTLEQAGRAVTAAQDAAQGRRGELAVGYSPLMLGFLPETLKLFDRMFPDVAVSLVELAMAEQMAAVEAGTLQLGFTFHGILPIPRALRHVEVLRSPVRVIMGRRHRLAKARRIALADLVSEPLLYLSNRSGTLLHAETVRPMFSRRGLKPATAKRINGAEPFRAMLESGAGVSLIPQVATLARSPDLVARKLNDTGDDLVLKVHALWTGGTASALVDNFLAALRKTPIPGASED